MDRKTVYVMALTLYRLAAREIAAMIDRVTGNKALPESIRQDIIERTDGIPLFIEEMTKAVLEAESESEARKTTSAVRPRRMAVPASLHASLMARLDRLGPAKEVAQIGAAIGREFSHPVLALWSAKRKRKSSRHSTVSSQQACCSGRVLLLTRPICSNTRLYRTLPIACCCANLDGRFTPVSPKHLRANSPTLPRASRNYWRVTAPRLG